jgi:hypothetical protein
MHSDEVEFKQIPVVHELPGGKGRERVISFADEVKYLSKASRTVKDATMLAVERESAPTLNCSR